MVVPVAGGSFVEYGSLVRTQRVAFMHHFAQRRVREDRVDEVRLGSSSRLADRIALDQFGDLGADHVRAEQLAGLRVEHGLYEAFRLAERDRLAVADEGELADLDLVALSLAAASVSPTDATCGLAIGAARNVLGCRCGWTPCCPAPAMGSTHDHALVAGLVRQPGRRRSRRRSPRGRARWCGHWSVTM